MSTLRVDSIQNRTGGSAISVPGAAKAWVNFNGTGTVSVRQALNVSSITDNGVGTYTVNFSTALAHADYAVALSGSIPSGVAGQADGEMITGTATASSLQVISYEGGSSGDPSDRTAISVVCFG